MPETVMSGRAWRIDRFRSSQSAVQSLEVAEKEPACNDARLEEPAAAAEPDSRRVGLAGRLSQGARDWLWRRVGRRWLGHARFEALMHRFAALVDRSDDPADVEAALLQIVRQMVPSSRVELVPLAESQHHEETSGVGDAAESGSESGANERTLEIPLRCGASIYARLRIRPRAGGKSRYRTEDVRRLATIATMGACAMEGMGLFTEWPETTLGDAERRKPRSGDVTPADAHRRAIQLQDATFLNAVLPFARSPKPDGTVSRCRSWLSRSTG